MPLGCRTLEGWQFFGNNPSDLATCPAKGESSGRGVNRGISRRNPEETASEGSGELGNELGRSRRDPEETASEGSGELGRECRPLRVSIMASLARMPSAPSGLFATS